jgi:hypothetical protein
MRRARLEAFILMFLFFTIIDIIAQCCYPISVTCTCTQLKIIYVRTHIVLSCLFAVSLAFVTYVLYHIYCLVI